MAGGVTFKIIMAFPLTPPAGKSVSSARSPRRGRTLRLPNKRCRFQSVSRRFDENSLCTSRVCFLACLPVFFSQQFLARRHYNRVLSQCCLSDGGWGGDCLFYCLTTMTEPEEKRFSNVTCWLALTDVCHTAVFMLARTVAWACDKHGSVFLLTIEVFGCVCKSIVVLCTAL